MIVPCSEFRGTKLAWIGRGGVLAWACLGFTRRRAICHQHCVEVQALRWCDQVVETMAAAGSSQR